MQCRGGRRDWGFLVGVYARALDQEVRKVVGPLVRRLEEAGFLKELAKGWPTKLVARGASLCPEAMKLTSKGFLNLPKRTGM